VKKLTTWDKGLNFEETYAKLLKALKKAKTKEKIYTAIAILQLTNGLRASEAARALLTFLKTKQIELEVAVSKKKHPETRLVVIPKPLLDLNLSVDANEKTLTNRYKSYLKWRYGFNSHSLRYAFITYLLRQGINASLIAKITHHSRLDYILTYTQQKTSENILRELINNL